MELQDFSVQAGRFMLRVAEHIRPHFPQYASTLADQVQGRKMTNDRWNAVAAVLSSLGALPGTHFRPEEHDSRNPALAAVIVAQKMAAATFGGRVDVPMTLDFVGWLIKEIEDRLNRPEKGSDGQEKE